MAVFLRFTLTYQLDAMVSLMKEEIVVTRQIPKVHSFFVERRPQSEGGKMIAAAANLDRRRMSSQGN